MKTEVCADRLFPNDWRVEAVDNATGDWFVAIFSGPSAEIRAKHYATLKMWPSESSVGASPEEEEK